VLNNRVNKAVLVAAQFTSTLIVGDHDYLIFKPFLIGRVFMLTPFSRKALTIFLCFFLLCVILLSCVYCLLERSLPLLDGEISVEGLQSSITINRDAQGIATIKSNSRQDSAFALGFLHAQERFFQMDMLRRNSGGELSQLLGARALVHDKKIRIHQFRKRAENALKSMPDKHLKILTAYKNGVNTGLNNLAATSFEYLLLNAKTMPWKMEDSLMVLYSMYMDLQPIWGQSERSMAVMRDLLPKDWFEFLLSPGGYWDAPIEGKAFTENNILPKRPLKSFEMTEITKNESTSAYRDKIHYGSNNWSVSGALTQNGAGMVANDMHLGLQVPNIWYRASWYLPNGWRVTGATLPGTPALVAGSNEHIAWGFTNSQGDYSDVIVLQTNEDESEYLTEHGWKKFNYQTETIFIKDQEPQDVNIKHTQWGPVIGKNHKDQLLVLRWVAHDKEGANMQLLELENAKDINDALNTAAVTGMPGQNLNVVDKTGDQAWSIMGRLPKRVGFDNLKSKQSFFASQFPTDWSDGKKIWQGYLSPDQYPRVINPVHGRIWTANARVASSENLQRVGVNNYALGARQKQIRDDLFEKEKFSEADFLNIQLDDRALFLQRWQKLMLSIIKKNALELGESEQTDANKKLAEVALHLENWQGRASQSSVGYLLVKRFRERVINNTLGHIYRYIEMQTTDFWPSSIDNFIEYPVWQLVTEQPIRHLPEGFDHWQDFLIKQIEMTRLKLTENGQPLDKSTWGQRNTLAIKHPLSAALPFLSYWLDMPAEPMAGDTYMPRVQDPDTGASERFAVAPGHEDKGYFHMATGQSAHPLSPYYKRGHDDWVEGRASPFLPQQARWTLFLTPQGAAPEVN